MIRNIFRSNAINNCNISSVNGHNKVVINGVEIKNIPNGNISISNGKIFVDGKEFDSANVSLSENNTINIFITGNVGNIQCNGSVDIKGNVSGSIECGGSVTVGNNTYGNIDCSGNVTVERDVNGDIDCSGSVKIGGSVDGDIDSCGSVTVGKR